MIVRVIESEEVRRHDRGRQRGGRYRDNLWRTGIVLRQLSSVRLEKLFRRGEVFGLWRNARIGVLRKGLLLELRGAIKAHDRAHHHVAHLKLGTDPTRGSGGNDELRLHL